MKHIGLRLKALILDVDGTLADTEEAHRSAFNEAFEQQGLDWNWSKPKYAHLLSVTGGKERLSGYVDSLGLADPEANTFKAMIPAIHAAKTANYTRLVLAGEVPLRDGVERLLDEAQSAGVRLGIATTTTFANIQALLEVNLGPTALQRFAVIGAGDQVDRKKPAPDIYELVLRELGESATHCVAIEDSRNGLLAAKGAGLFTLVTPSYWTRTEDFAAADLVLPSLGSAERPLPARAAELVGTGIVGIREINEQLNNYENAKSASDRQHA